MENKKIQHELARKIQQCLSEAGVKAEVDLSEHEAVVYAHLATQAAAGSTASLIQVSRNPQIEQDVKPG
jgi:hypothetical protein